MGPEFGNYFWDVGFWAYILTVGSGVGAFALRALGLVVSGLGWMLSQSVAVIRRTRVEILTIMITPATAIKGLKHPRLRA